MICALQLEGEFSQPNTLACVLCHFGHHIANAKQWLDSHTIAVKAGWFTVNKDFVTLLANILATVLLVCLVISLRMVASCDKSTHGSGETPLCEILDFEFM